MITGENQESKMDKNYWKNAYKELWGKADEKEREVKKVIEKLLNVELTFYGLGAGSTEFVQGNAKDNNQAKGDADLYIQEFDTFIEVTGPMIKVNEKDTIWIRPDKARNAINKIKAKIGKHHFVIHVAKLHEGITLYRAVQLGQNIEDAYKKGSIKYITPTIRGIKEKYLEIPHDHEYVYNLDELKNIIEKT